MEHPLYPRLYECGHTLCEICMKNNDQAESDRCYDIFQATNFSCPICRHSSITPWYLRPINRSLLDILLKDENYIKKHDEYTKKRIDISATDINIPENSDLSFVSRQRRNEKAEQIYKKLLPLLFEAATHGKSRIILTRDAEDIKIVSDLLTEKLFKNNIYKLTTSSRECTIEIIPSEKNYTCEFINENYIENNSIFSNAREITQTSTPSPNISPLQSPTRSSPRRRSRRNY